MTEDIGKTDVALECLYCSEPSILSYRRSLCEKCVLDLTEDTPSERLKIEYTLMDFMKKIHNLSRDSLALGARLKPTSQREECLRIASNARGTTQHWEFLYETVFSNEDGAG